MFYVTVSVISFLQKFAQTANFPIIQRKFFYQAPSTVAFISKQKFCYNTIFFCKNHG